MTRLFISKRWLRRNVPLQSFSKTDSEDLYACTDPVQNIPANSHPGCLTDKEDTNEEE